MQHKPENKRKSANNDTFRPVESMGPPQKRLKATPSAPTLSGAEEHKPSTQAYKPKTPYPVARDGVLNVYALIRPDRLPAQKQAIIQEHLNRLQDEKSHCQDRIETLERQLSDVDTALACKEFDGLKRDDGDLVERMDTANGKRTRSDQPQLTKAAERTRTLANLSQCYGMMEANLAAQAVTIQAGTYVLEDQTIKLRTVAEEAATFKLQLQQTKTKLADAEHRYNEELSALKAGNVEKDRISQLFSAMAYDLFPTHIVQSAHPPSAGPNIGAIALREAHASRTLTMVKGLQDGIAQRDETISSLRSQGREEAERTRRMQVQHKKDIAARENEIAEQKATARQLQVNANTTAAKLEEFRKFNGEQQALIERLTDMLRRGGRMAS